MPEVILNDLDSYQLFKDEIIRLNPIYFKKIEFSYKGVEQEKKLQENTLIYMFSCLIRLLLLCDQLHDFDQNETRNALFNYNTDYTNAIFENFKYCYDSDINYLFNTIFKSSSSKKDKQAKKDTIDTLIILKVSNKKNPNIQDNTTFKEIKEIERKNFQGDKKYAISIQIVNICTIKQINLRTHYREKEQKEEDQDLVQKRKGGWLSQLSSWECTKNYEYLPNALKSINKNYYSSNLNIFVDALSSKYNTSMISNLICDIHNDKNSKTEIKFIETYASDYDAAKTSGLASLLKDFAGIKDKIEYSNIENVKCNSAEDYIKLMHDTECMNISLKLKIQDSNNTYLPLELIKLKYESITNLANLQKYSDDPKKYIDKLNKLITSRNKNIEKSDDQINVADLENVNNASKLSKFLTSKKHDLLDYPEFGQYYSTNMQINTFFSYDFTKLSKDYKKNNLQKDSNDAALPKITRFINDTDLLFNCAQQLANKQYIIKPVCNEQFVHQTLFKTMGDFGQILSAYIISNKTSNNMTYFLTFDRMCGHMSSLFNYGTLLEVDKIVEFPINIYVPEKQIKNININISWISFFKQCGSDAIDILSKRFRGNQFGKSEKLEELKILCKKYSIRLDKNCVKNLKIKLEGKKLGLKVKKVKISLLKQQINRLKILSKRYKLKLDKNILKNLKSLIKIQIKAKKNKIKITKIVNGKRVYKTEKELKKTKVTY